MESAWPLLLFLAGLFGFTLLILIFGIHGRELERAEAACGTGGQAPETGRSFFATLDRAFAPPLGVDDATVQNVERRLRLLTQQADRFVESPSLHTFHDFGEGGRLEEESLFCRFKRFLEQEEALAGEFVSDPSLARFHGTKLQAM